MHGPRGQRSWRGRRTTVELHRLLSLTVPPSGAWLLRAVFGLWVPSNSHPLPELRKLHFPEATCALHIGTNCLRGRILICCGTSVAGTLGWTKTQHPFRDRTAAR